MSKIFKLLSFSFAIFLLSFSLKAQNVYFNSNDGSTNTYSLEDVRKMTFDDSQVTLELNDGTTFQWDMADVVSFKYDNEITNLSLVENINNIDLKIYPNPNSGKYNLSYNISNNADVVIEMFSIDGKFITQLFSGNQTSGNQILNFDLNNISKGVYIVQLKTNDFSITKKLIIDNK